MNQTLLLSERHLQQGQCNTSAHCIKNLMLKTLQSGETKSGQENTNSSLALVQL